MSAIIAAFFIPPSRKCSEVTKKAAKITDSERLVGTLVIIYLSGVMRGF